MRRVVISESTGAIRVEDAVDSRPRLELPREEQTPVLTLGDRIAAYVALTKPRIIELLLITTVPAMIVAERGLPSLTLVLLTLLGGTMSAAGANAINCYIDRDIDEVMTRTRRRPIPSHRVEPARALVFGIVLGAAAFLQLWSTVNLLAAVLATSALLFYVFVYTLLLKRTTPQNIVIGGAAGAVPVLVGWAAVTGTVELPALVLFAIVFYWTPPHFWALSLRYERDYAAAGVPMMPVVYGTKETTKHILLYSLLLLAMCLAFFSVARMGLVYLVAAVLLNAGFIALAVRLYRRPDVRVAWHLFKYSIYYLALLFASAAIDQLITA
jgi:protoheme IX farnesyltransferase